MNIETKKLVVYKAESWDISIDVTVQWETLRLPQKKIAELFDVNIPAISKHITNIVEEGELDGCATVSKMEIVQKEWTRSVSRNVEFYNLDMIIAIWYRVNSKHATQFRIRATNILKQHIVQWYSFNQQRLQEVWFSDLEQSLQLVRKTLKNIDISHDEATWLLDIITQYAQSWLLLYKYDKQEDLTQSLNNELIYKITATDAQKSLNELKSTLIEKDQASDLFAFAKDSNSLEWIFGSIYQTFWWKDVYSSIEEKAAHLLYFVVKNHPFADGNKRSGAFLFILFCERNNVLLSEKGGYKINDKWLVALTLLIAQSDPKEKELMTQLVMNLLS